MKFCPYCGSALDDDMRFCPKCGNQYKEGEAQESEIQTKQTSSPHTTTSKKKPIWEIILIALGVVVAFWWPGFDKSDNDPTANYETDYNQGVSFYEGKNYSKAQESFLKVGEDYKNTELYLILCEGHIRKKLTNEQVSVLKRNLDFCDAKSLFLSEPLARKFLVGYWSDENGKKYLEYYEQEASWGVSTNLDNSNTNWDKAEGFYVKDGIFGLAFPKASNDGDSKPKEYENKDLFRITILDWNKISLVVLKDNSRITLTREG